MSSFNFIITAIGMFLLSVWILQFSQIDGWDIYHFMYSGQRLLEGELNWTIEYFDKLIISQIIFVIPALFKSIQVWYLISAVTVIISAWACYKIVNYVLSDNTEISLKDRKFASYIAACSVVYLSSVLPGGLMHVNVASSSAAILALALFVLSSAVSSSLLFRKYTLFFLSTLSASISIGIRPYFLFALIFTIALFLIFKSRSFSGYKSIFFQLVLWVFGVGIFGILINVVPYFIIGDVSAFIAGMSLLSQILNPTQVLPIIGNIILDIEKQQILTIILIVLSFSSSIAALIYIFSFKDINSNLNRMMLNITLLTFISPLLILVMIFSRHYWSHYLQMFAPFWSVGVGFFYFFFNKQYNLKEALISNHIKWSLAISLVLFAIMPPFVKNIKEINDTILNKSELSVGQIRVREVSNILSNQLEGQRDFLFIDDMRTHFILNEYRHGFPQAALTRHIVKYENLKNVNMPDRYKYPTNSEEYCEMIEKMGPSIIFVANKIPEFETSCLSKTVFYSYKKKLQTNVSVYIRN